MSSLENTFRVAIYDGFLDAFAKIPRAQQRKVNEFIRKFRRDPMAKAINYESIDKFRDPNLRTVRIDQAWRAIVRKPDQGNVYLLLWVDHHDKAMAWAENKRIEVHPDTGSLQVLTGTTVEEEPEPEAAPTQAPEALFDGFRDRELRRLGVPDASLPLVRRMRSELDLEEAEASLPPDAFEALSYLAMGESLDDVHAAMAVTAHDDEVDTSDIDAALERPVTQARFKVLTDDDELAAMLDAPLDKWRVFLHPSQRRLVEGNSRGPTRVLGGPGTGKTVVAMHRAVWLAENAFPADDDRILFTTFTRNLAVDIGENIKRIAPADVTRRIEVTALDRWVGSFLKARGYSYRIAYWGMPGSPLKELWEEALAARPHGERALPKGFYREEWSWVVQEHGCTSLRDYVRADRTGRGVRMSRRQRKEAWPVFEAYQTLLEERGLREPEDAMRDATRMLEAGEARATYAAIVVDEAQDLSTNAFRLLRALIPEERPNDLFIVGDGHQRIYRRRVVLSHAGINVRGRRSSRLRINYRTTDEIRKLAVAVMEGVDIDDLDAGRDDTKGYRSLFHGVEPSLARCDTFDAEVEAITAFLKGDRDERRSCLVARTHRLLEQYDAALEEAGFATHHVHREEADDLSTPGVRLATMHRVKGLEFDRVVVAGVNQDLVPMRAAVDATLDPAVKSDTEALERSLLYVAITRARRALMVSCHDGVGSGVIGWERPSEG